VTAVIAVIVHLLKNSTASLVAMLDHTLTQLVHEMMTLGTLLERAPAGELRIPKLRKAGRLPCHRTRHGGGRLALRMNPLARYLRYSRHGV
jgi:hypothetical protein